MQEKTKRRTEKFDYTRLVKRELEILQSTFGSFYTYSQVQHAITQAESVKHKSSAKSDFLAILKMFEGTKVDVSTLRSLDDMKKALPLAGFYDQDEFNLHLVRSVYDKFKSFPKSGNYIERVVRRLGDPDFTQDSVRLAILKQFIKYTDYNTMPIIKYVLAANLDEQDIKKLSKKAKTQFVLAHIDESIFEIIEGDITQEERRKFTLLKLADDLSKARFRTNGRTRSDLFVMAIAFNMTCFLDLPGQVFDAERDFQKNLLFDFYNDSPMRYISEDYRSNATNYEAEPTGEGINFKNFAEIIYVYYMNKESLTAGERLKKAEDMIKSCKLTSSQAHLAVEPDSESTQGFIESHLIKVLSLSEDALKDYIIAHFVVPVQGDMGLVHGEKKNRCTFDSYQTTARVYYREFADFIKDAIGDTSCEDLVLETSLDDTLVNDEDFMRVLEVMNNQLVLTEAKLNINDSESISRNRLLTLFAYKYYLEDMHIGLSFPELFEDFCIQANEMLDECRFQHISEKNLFDYFLIVCLFLDEYTIPIDIG